MIEDFIIALESFEIIDTLGEGSFGKVYLIRQKQIKTLYAAKILKFHFQKYSKEQQLFFQELLTFSKINHPTILPLYGFNFANFEDQPYPTIITEYMTKGSLHQIFTQNVTLSPSIKYIILYGIAEGMNYLHSKGIIHRKLSPNNILTDSNFYPHICDFEESKMSDLSESLNHDQQNIISSIYTN